jgi:3-oxoadipate enol-lactonase
VLLLHGWRATATANWQSCLEPLSRHHRVIALDHRGHGQGIRSEERFSLEACADDAAALLDVLDVREAIVVGYSMGGPIAQLLWRRHRERVSALVFCATASDMRVAHPALVAAAQDLEGVLGVVPRSLRMAGMRAVAGRVAVDDHHRELLVDGFVAHDQRIIRQAGWAVGRFRSTAWIGAVDVPAEVVVTARDHVVLPARQLELARRIPGAHATVVEAGHLACSNDPDVFAAAVDGAVRRAADRRRPRWWRRARELLGA